MLWAILILVSIIIGYVIYSRKKNAPRLSDQKIKDIVARQMKHIEDMIVSASVEGKTVSIPPVLAHLEESKVEHAGDEKYIAAIDNLKKEIIKKYGSRIPPDEAFIDNGEMIIWSEFPGCFERHLQRRYRNILFPSERRSVSIEEIAQARKKDEIDQDKFIEAVRNFGIEMENSEDTDPLSTLRDSSSLEKTQALLEKAASIGGNIRNAIYNLEAGEENTIQWLNESMPEGKDLLEKAKSHSMMARIPFMAQLKRKDTPILPNEEVPTLLSEDLATISVIGFVSRSFPDFKPCEADIRKHLDAAIQQGFSKKQAIKLINAWNEMKSEIL